MFEVDTYWHETTPDPAFPPNAWVVDTLIKMGINRGRLEMNVGSDEWLRGINLQFLNHDYYTDIVTFDLSDSNGFFGELCISIDRAKENADQYTTSLSQEFKRLVVHGVLHLKGYKDTTSEEKRLMRGLEDKYI